jgi:hypothetical protein
MGGQPECPDELGYKGGEPEKITKEGRRSDVVTQGRSNCAKPPRVVPVDFCLAPIAPTFYHFDPLSTTLTHFVPPGGKTTQKSSVQPGFTSVPSDRQGFPLGISGTRRISCPDTVPVYLANYVFRGAHLLLKYSMCLYRTSKVLLWVHYRVNGLSVS